MFLSKWWNMIATLIPDALAICRAVAPRNLFL